jgi:hypothetical protein
MDICFNIIHHQLSMNLSNPFCKSCSKGNDTTDCVCTCVQVLASTAKNMLLLDLGMTISFPTIVIPKLRNTDDPLALNDEQASWFGKSLFCGSEVQYCVTAQHPRVWVPI